MVTMFVSTSVIVLGCPLVPSTRGELQHSSVHLHWLAGTGAFPDRGLIPRHKLECVPLFNGFSFTHLLSLLSSSPFFDNWYLFINFYLLARLCATAPTTKEVVRVGKAFIVSINHLNHVATLRNTVVGAVVPTENVIKVEQVVAVHPVSLTPLDDPNALSTVVDAVITAKEVPGLEPATVARATLHLAVPVVDILRVEEPVLAPAERPIAARLRDCGSLSICKLVFRPRLGHASHTWASDRMPTMDNQVLCLILTIGRAFVHGIVS